MILLYPNFSFCQTIVKKPIKQKTFNDIFACFPDCKITNLLFFKHTFLLFILPFYRLSISLTTLRTHLFDLNLLLRKINFTINIKYKRILTLIMKILLVSIPIALTAIMSSLNKNIDSFTVVRSLKEFMSDDMAVAQYGILGGKVDTLTSLPLSINVAFATALVPAISAAKAKKDQKTITQKTSFSLLTSMLIGLPCTVGMCIFAGPILNLLFPNASAGATVLQISSLTIIFTILDQTINGALQGYGKLAIPAISLRMSE